MFQLQTIKLNAPIHIQMQIVARSVAFAPNRFYDGLHQNPQASCYMVSACFPPHRPTFSALCLFVCVCVCPCENTQISRQTAKPTTRIARRIKPYLQRAAHF